MNLKDATALALVYKKVTKDVLEAYTKLIEKAIDAESLEGIKMIRFENDSKKMAAVCNTYSVITSVQNPLNSDEEVKVIRYQLPAFHVSEPTLEKGYRYMFYSPAFTESFSVRLFTNEVAYKRFIHTPHIKVTMDLEFRGATLALYTSKGSDVARVVIFCDGQCDLTPEDLAEHIGYTVTSGDNNASKTAVFK